ncbi:hypothetical protein [Virgibacillus profundi]|uniref:hypothetical protein n=1 Tax=Virgibacillus profundi TaxID=2024555 RepID=UPI000C28B69E|nr:hypothetical protein [Virgibacillus profundi]PXY55387.1 hypothetical protein CIT14_00665 [Virgibacillus profundi]
MKWEYMITENDERLSELGSAGWELVSAIKQKTGIKLYLKKPVQSFRDRITVDQRKEVYKDFNMEEADEKGRNSTSGNITIDC